MAVSTSHWLCRATEKRWPSGAGVPMKMICPARRAAHCARINATKKLGSGGLEDKIWSKIRDSIGLVGPWHCLETGALSLPEVT